MPKSAEAGLSATDVEHFLEAGFVQLDEAFSAALADECRNELWTELGLSPHGWEPWPAPVVRLAFKSSRSFVEAANTPRLHEAYDRLAGRGQWLRPQGIGTFPIRFPSSEAPGDDGWHVDMSFGTDAPDFMDWRINVRSRGRALLMLFLFSDVGPDDAPTRIRRGSHRTIARQLRPHAEAGLALRELSADGFASTEGCETVLATGKAGTVYLCHPFLVHAAQPHRGSRPRFMGQPPLLPAEGIDPGVADSPVQAAIERACAPQT